MSKSKFEISKEKGQHLRLINLVGSWEGNTSTWFEKDVLARELKILKEIAIQHDLLVLFNK